MRHRHVRLRVRDPGVRNELEDDLAAELVTRREFWNRIERGDARQLLVVVFESRKEIGDRWGIEPTDIADKLFDDICRFAAEDADVEARLAVTVFAAYWKTPGRDRIAKEVFQRWFPMGIKTPVYELSFEARWFGFEVSSGETSREVFDRVFAEVGAGALWGGWDFQVS